MLLFWLRKLEFQPASDRDFRIARQAYHEPNEVPLKKYVMTYFTRVPYRAVATTLFRLLVMPHRCAQVIII